jgi:hypothetical protein
VVAKAPLLKQAKPAGNQATAPAPAAKVASVSNN